MEKIYERRSMKDELKEKVLANKDINHKMLKEVHSLRYENVQNNLVKEQERKKQYQEELALKLEIQKYKMQTVSLFRKK